VEIFGGLISGSLAILTDAAHMLSDVAGFLISMFSIWIGQRSGNFSNTYGYHRAEVLGAMMSILLIWAILIWLVLEAIQRVIDLESYKLDAKVMFFTSLVSLICNLFSLIALGHGPCFKSNAEILDNI
jgi:zinc transporter 2